jgi:hypothetical protein
MEKNPLKEPSPSVVSAKNYYKKALELSEENGDVLLKSHALKEPLTAKPDVIVVHFISAKVAIDRDITAKNRGAFEKFLLLKKLAATRAHNRDGIKAGNIPIPRMMAEYKKAKVRFNHATNQIRNQLIAAVEFLAALNIYDFPIYGLAIRGPKCRLYMAWKTQRKGQLDLTSESTVDEILSNEVR